MKTKQQKNLITASIIFPPQWTSHPIERSGVYVFMSYELAIFLFKIGFIWIDKNLCKVA